MSQVPHKDYQKILNDLKEKIRRSRLKAAMVVNHELLKIYWEIGNTILTQQKIEGWGAKIIDRLATDLKGEFPDFRGFSLRNLKYMRAFAEAYPDFLIVQVPLAQSEEINDPRDEFVQVPLAQITWYHHITLLGKVKDPIARLFYIHKTIANGWSRDVLVLQIESNLFERQGKAINNFSQTLPQPDSDLAIQTFKNPYVLDFLDLNESVKERDVERALIEHLKKFMLELGRGFSYVGNQFKLNVEEDDYFLDLLFYNYHLHRFILFELKIGEFKPEYIGKLNFYINTVNEQIRGLEDKTTIGILLCKTPNETVVKYSLENIKTPIGVANYKITNDLPRQLKGEIPSAKELEGVLNNKAENMEKPLEQKLNKIKQALRIKKSRD
jgi:predicted nuclease of restriction endonuclease-like (RecB) superfamily